MRVSVRPLAAPTHRAPETLLGQNLELAGDTVAGLRNNRLANHKFAGPPDPMTGVAPGWQPAFTTNTAGVNIQLVRGLGLSGEYAQVMHNTCGQPGRGILQINRAVRAGERLRVALWARAQGHPVALRVGIMPLRATARPYAEATLRVESAIWGEYAAILPIHQDDDQAVFYCLIEERGAVALDQITLAPEGEPPVRRDLTEAFAGLHMPVLRFPGGCITTNYHWKLGVGPRHLRPLLPDPVFKWETAYDYGVDDYLELCLAQGIRPQISLNLGTGTVEEAEEWAAYVWEWFRARQVEPPAMYWQIGNEQWGAWEVGNMTGEMYADALRQFVPAVRRAYPTARIVALGPETGEGLEPGVRQPWRAPVLERAADLIDVLAGQRYVRPSDEEPLAQLASALRGADENAEALARLADDCAAAGRRVGRQINAAMTEWNLWRYAGHYDERGFWERNDATHGLFVAANLHHFARLAPRLELCNFYHLLNPMGLFISRGPEIEATPTVKVFQLYRPAFPGDFIPLDVRSPEMARGVAAVDALGLQGDAKRYLFLANRSLDEAADVELSSWPAGAEVQLLIASGPDGDWAAESIRTQGEALRLPPLTIARIAG